MNNRLPHLIPLAAAAALALSIPTFDAAAASAPARAENAFLSQADAAARAARVSNVAYQLDFVLSGKETFSGTTTLHFDLKDASTPLTVDLDKATIIVNLQGLP